MKAAAIIPAAGMGTRMRSASPKQFLTLQGTPIVVHTLRKFLRCEEIQKIVVPLRKADIPFFETLLEQEKIPPLVELVVGGVHRQDSVFCGFKQIGEDTEVVVVHDAVRPFVDVELIRSVIRVALEKGGAILALPCVDTVKQIERNIIEATLARDKIVLAQTPQAFRYGILREGFEKARQDHFYATDESCLVERLGYEVNVIRGSERNIKITKPGDLPLAELYAQQERF
ncbi:MAG TPA: 2-C-methyl-D-erythritol 4-phosphate cytidylyltransferase [Terriglobia bacterium]|nr:2-C-methyl-D-erythritol 4-phosphate cytidylyltransferase [Terriglobia bacterium]